MQNKENKEKQENEGKLKIKTPYQITSIKGEDKIEAIVVKSEDGKEESVLPKDISFDVITDEPIHIDFLRVVKGSSIIIEILSKSKVSSSRKSLILI